MDFCWQSVPKPWTGDSETPVTEPGVHPRYDTCQRQLTVAYKDWN